MRKFLTSIACVLAISASAQIAEVGKPEIVSSRVRTAAMKMTSVQGSISVSTNRSNLIINRNGVEKVVSPVDSYAGYIWASLSPDNSKIVFLAAGYGLVVTDLDGNVIATPGYYSAPSWFGNDHLVVENTTDDGHQFHSAQILLISLDGKQVQSLTEPESMTLNPYGDADNNTVWFKSIDGINYRQSVILK